MRDLLKKASKKSSDTEHNIRPKRKAATASRQNPVSDDSEIDDSDADAHYQCPGEESSSDESIFSDNNNDVEPEKPAKSSRKS